jgi:3'-5' exoribonuclease
MTRGEKAETKSPTFHPWIKDIKEDDNIHGRYLVKAKKTGQTKNGDPFISITLSDRTGDAEARVWDNALELSSLFNEGDILEVEGHATSYKHRIQLVLSSLKVSDEGDPIIFLESTQGDINKMMDSLRGIIAKIKDAHLKSLSNRFLSDRTFTELFKRAPAAKNFHHNYIGGLLEHTLSVCEMSLHVTEQYQNLDKDLMISGAFLHDIGKIREFRYDTWIEYSDEGRLLGHLVQGIAMVDEKLAGIKNFPDEKALRLKHIILSHHGEYEFGSTKRPKFLEAFALHLIDDLDAKMNGLSRFMEKDAKEGAWTDFNKMFDRYFLKDRLSQANAEKHAVPADDDRQKVLFNEYRKT